jgi:SAM-dependent methyltransferase
MKNLLPEGVKTYWAQNVWDRGIFEKSDLGKKFINQRKLIISAIKKYKPSSVLVLCCGVGRETKDILECNFVNKIVAIDINQVSCGKTKRRVSSKNVKVINKDVYSIEYEENFDAVVCLDALHHLGKQDLILNKIYKSLKLGGVFFGDYFGKEHFMPWMIKKHGFIKAMWINAKHHIANTLFKFHILPRRLITGGWMRTFLFTRKNVESILSQHGFEVLDIVSDEWHFFVAKKLEGVN